MHKQQLGLAFRMKKKKQNPFKKNKFEIIYEVINAFVCGFLVFLGGITSLLATSDFTTRGFIISIISSLVASITIFFIKLQNYWASEKDEYCPKILQFV